MKRLFLDCEFTGLIQNTSLISLALYENEDSYFYAEFDDYNQSQITPWIQENVMNKLFFVDGKRLFRSGVGVVEVRGGFKEIAGKLKAWLGEFGEIEIWGDVPVYDWMLFCQLFGGALNLPKNIFYIPLDIATLGRIVAKKRDFSRIEYVKEQLQLHEVGFQHNALFDAKVEKLCFEKLMQSMP